MKPRCTAFGCKNLATVVCVFPLRGRHAGKTCERALCDKCAAANIGICPPHARLAVKQKRELS